MCNYPLSYDQRNKQTNNPYAGLNTPTNANMQPVNDTFRTSSQFGANQYAPQSSSQLTYKTSSGTIHSQKNDSDFLYEKDFEKVLFKITGLTTTQLDELDHEKGTYGATDYLIYDSKQKKFEKVRNLDEGLMRSKDAEKILIIAGELSEKGLEEFMENTTYASISNSSSSSSSSSDDASSSASSNDQDIKIQRVGSWLQDMPYNDAEYEA